MNKSNIIFSSLKAHPHFYSDAIKLIEEEFHYSSEYRFEIDFAPLIDPSNYENCLIAIDTQKNKLVGHVASTSREMTSEGETLSVNFIGGIVTHKDYRGKNIFRSLMTLTLEKYSNAGLFFLWSDIDGLYEKFDFFRSGGLVETGKNVICRDNIPDEYSKTHFHLLSNSDFGSLKKIYQKNIENFFFTVKREDKDWSIIRKMESVDLYIKRDAHHNICNYFCVNKGRDLQCVIHELATEDLSHSIEKLSQFKLWLPEYFSTNFPNTPLQYVSFIRIGNSKVLEHFLDRKSKGRFSNITLEKNKLAFVFDHEEYVLTHKDFLNCLFGPMPAEEFKFLRLSPYISGLDSV